MATSKLIFLLFPFIFLISYNAYSQDTAFDSGFNKAFKESCYSQGYGEYALYGNPKKCEKGISNGAYDTDYREGYRCGTIQAISFIEDLKASKKNSLKIKANENDNEIHNNQITYSDPTYIDIYKDLEDYNDRKPIDYGKPIKLDIFYNNIIVPQKHYYNPLDYKRTYIENKAVELIKKDEKIDKNNKIIKLKETSINKKLIANNKKYQINELIDNGWYEVYYKSKLYFKGEKYETLIKKFVYVKNHTIIYWVGKYDIIYNVTYFQKKGFNTYDLKIEVTNDINDKKIISSEFYFISNVKCSGVPSYTYPTTLSVYTKRNIDGKDILFSIKNYDESEKDVNFISQKWKDYNSPNCYVYENLAKFTLPKGKYHYFAYSDGGTDFWEGDINIENICTTFELR